MIRRCLAMLLLLIGACGGDDDGASRDAGEDRPDAACAGGGEPAVVYLNRNGATFAPGPEDSIADTTSVVEEARSFDPYPYDNWAELVACFTDGLTTFDIDV